MILSIDNHGHMANHTYWWEYHINVGTYMIPLFYVNNWNIILSIDYLFANISFWNFWSKTKFIEIEFNIGNFCNSIFVYIKGTWPLIIICNTKGRCIDESEVDKL